VKYLAPSWSWAACSGYVEWEYNTPDTRIIKECEIIDVQISIIGKDEMGCVNSGYLRLSRRVKWLKN